MDSIMRRLKPLGKSAAQHHDEGPEVDDATGASAEGFLCPVCMAVQPSPEALQKHYETAHSEPSSAQSGEGEAGSVDERRGSVFTCPHCFEELSSPEDLQTHFSTLHEHSDPVLLSSQLADLRASLKEEKWYTERLKAELSQLQSQMLERSRASLADPSSADETAYLQQQIQALEAGKALVTSRMLEFEKECFELKRSNENIQREKQRIMKKSAHMAKDHVQLRAQVDEENSQKVALGEEVLTLKTRIYALEKQLDQRPSEDDVEVLRKELVHAQTLMDVLTQEKEKEIVMWKAQSHQAQLQYQESSKTVELLQTQLGAVAKTDDLTKLQSSMEASAQRIQKDLETKRDAEELEKQLEAVGAELKDTAGKLEATTAELNVSKEKMSELSKTISTLNDELASRTELASQLERKLQTTEERLEENEKQMSVQAQSLTDLGERLSKSENEEESRREEAEELSRQLKSVQEQLRDQESLVATENVNESLKAKLVELSSAKAQLTNRVGSLDSDVARLQAHVQKSETESAELKDEIAKLKMGLENARVLEEELREQWGKVQKELDGTRQSAKIQAESFQERSTLASSHLMEKENLIETLKNELDLAMKENKDQSALKEKFESDLESCNERYEEVVAQKLSLETQTAEARREWEDKNRELEKRLADGQKRCTELQEQLGVSQQTERRSRDAAEQAQAELSKFQTASRTIQLDFQDRLSASARQLEGVEKAKKEAEAELESKQRTLLDQVETLTDNLTNLRAETFQNQQTIVAMKEQNALLESAKTELEAQLSAWSEEKRTLLERCLTMERDLEEERDKAEMMRRKLEDAIAGMQDLGREHQSLQIDLSKYSNRKWMADWEVGECMSCRKAFSVTIRRHHCRSCGLIFCNECSAQSAPIASSRRPVRVCGTCHSQLTSS